MQRINYARRRSRGGKKLLPPNPTQWEIEHAALDLRDDLRLTLDARLDHELAFSILPKAFVHPHGVIPAAGVHLNHFRTGGSSAWSGMAITTPDGCDLIFYNDCHPPTRIRATLMEEFFHIHLGHPRTVLRFYGEDGAGRSYDPAVEQEAYGCGAAALVPYASLRTMLQARMSPSQIADHFEVSEALVIFRAKVTRVYGSIRRR